MCDWWKELLCTLHPQCVLVSSTVQYKGVYLCHGKCCGITNRSSDLPLHRNILALCIHGLFDSTNEILLKLQTCAYSNDSSTKWASQTTSFVDGNLYSCTDVQNNGWSCSWKKKSKKKNLMFTGNIKSSLGLALLLRAKFVNFINHTFIKNKNPHHTNELQIQVCRVIFQMTHCYQIQPELVFATSISICRWRG